MDFPTVLLFREFPGVFPETTSTHCIFDYEKKNHRAVWRYTDSLRGVKPDISRCSPTEFIFRQK